MVARALSASERRPMLYWQMRSAFLVGEPVEFQLESPDVIHSFWIPALGGKMDMIPGRTTRLALEPTRPGVFRGVCAEYCGTAHALMAFSVVVMPKEEFDRWLDASTLDRSRTDRALVAIQGREAFLTNGCSACHAIRGTAADGVIGPDLTHRGQSHDHRRRHPG